MNMKDALKELNKLYEDVDDSSNRINWNEKFYTELKDSPDSPDEIKKAAEGKLDVYHPNNEYSVSIEFRHNRVWVERRWTEETYDEYADLGWHKSIEYYAQRIIEIDKNKFDLENIDYNIPSVDPIALAKEVLNKYNNKDYESQSNYPYIGKDPWDKNIEKVRNI